MGTEPVKNDERPLQRRRIGPVEKAAIVFLAVVILGGFVTGHVAFAVVCLLIWAAVFVGRFLSRRS
jgi:hypothetical protein